MPRNTRYDRLQSRIVNEFEASKTYEPSGASPSDSREVIVNTSDTEWESEHSPFSYNSPYNQLTVENRSSADVSVWLDKSKGTYFDVAAGESRALEVERFFNFVAVENIDSAESFADGEVYVHVGKGVGSRELRLLEMSGLLDISG